MTEAALAPRPTRRVSAWKIAAVFAAALVVLAVVVFFWIQAAADRRWVEMEKKVRELLAETKARDPSRPPLRGAAVPGNAWDDYQVALDEMKAFKSQDSVFGDFISRSPKADRSKVEPLVAAHLTALDALRRGAARSNGQFAVQWEKGFSADVPGLLQSQRLGNLAVCRSRFLAEEGKTREAAELILDTCQFAHDVGYNSVLISEMISIAIYSIAFEEVRDLILSGKLSREDLTEVGRELEQVDRSFPRNAHSMMNESLCAGTGFLSMNDWKSVGGLGVSGAESFLAWRYGFSSRLMLADAFDNHLEMMKRYAEGEGKPWSEIEKIGKGIEAEIPQLKNPISKIMIPGLTASARVGRERRAQLRLLRVAAHFCATGEVLELEDPLGAGLRTQASEGRLKVWSVGRNGSDDGGTGEWNPSKGLDIVLDVPR